MKFEDAIGFVLKYEGGYVNDPDDPGGETKFGISKKSYPDRDIKALSIADATQIYREDFWDKYGIEKLPPWIRLHVFDAAVNQGPVPAIMMLQKALEMVPVDGILGQTTALAAHKAHPIKLTVAYTNERKSRYGRSATFKTFGAGWLSRLVDVTLETVKEVGKVL